MNNLEGLYKNLHDSLHAFVLRRVKDKNAADDIVQDIFLKMISRRQQLREAEKVESWVFQIARNAVVDYFRQQSRHSGAISGNAEPAARPAEHDPTQQLAQWMPSAIDLLPEPYREALYLIEIEGISQKELAARLGISYSGAKSRVQRGREKLKEVVLKCCEVITDRYGNVLNYYPRPKADPCEDDC